MLNDTTLSEAVRRGLISAEQLVSLNRLEDELRSSGDEAPNSPHTSVSAEDEPFRLLKGFRDVFIAIGIGILVSGILSLTSKNAPGLMTSKWQTSRIDLSASFFMETLIYAVGLLVIIGVSEWVTRKQRLPLSGLVLTLAFAYFCGMFAATLVVDAFSNIGSNPEWWRTFKSIAALGMIAGVAAYFWRYRLPFALFPIAGAFVLLFSSFGNVAGNSWIIGVTGLCVFAAGMWYDLKDRYRITRLSECAFWLHLLAAPLIVHGTILLIAGGVWKSASSIEPAILLILIGVLALLAIVIDRRAFLVSALIYLGYAIYAIIENSGFSGNTENAITLVVLGAIVLTLGVGWVSIRRIVVKAIVPMSLREKLSPAF